MNISRIQRNILVVVTLSAPMPSGGVGLHMEEHKIHSVVTIESRYEIDENKLLTPADIRRVRASLAWTGTVPPFIDSLTIQSSTRVLARRRTRHSLFEIQVVKRGDQWIVETAARTELGNAF